MHNLDAVIAELQRAPTQEECLLRAHTILTTKYYGHRWKNFTRFFHLWPSPVPTLWKTEGHMHCTNMNRILKELLVQSGHFSEKDVELRWTLLWCISPHQYVCARLSDGRTVYVDPWAYAHGIVFGDYAHGFHAYGSG